MGWWLGGGVLILTVIACLIYMARGIGDWSWVSSFYRTSLFPWMKKNIPETHLFVEDLVCWADGDRALSPERIKECLGRFNQRVLGQTAEYQKTSTTSATRIVTTHVLLEQGTASKQVVTGDVSWDEIPAEIRAEMMRQNTQNASLDMKAVVLEKIKHCAREQGVGLEGVMT